MAVASLDRPSNWWTDMLLHHCVIRLMFNTLRDMNFERPVTSPGHSTRYSNNSHCVIRLMLKMRNLITGYLLVL